MSEQKNESKNEVKQNEVKLEDIVSLCKRRGFIFPGSDVYGGLAGTWDYGPLGVALKRNVMNLWWKMFVQERDDMHGVDAAILMNQKVWQASGHVDTFTDPLVECSNCKKRFRTDKLVDDGYKNALGNTVITVADMLEKTQENIDETIELFKYFSSFPGVKLGEEIDNRSSSILLNIKVLTDAADDLVLGKKYLGEFPKYYLNVKQSLKCTNCGLKDWSNSRAFNMMFKTNVGPVDDDASVSYLRPETAQGIFTNFKNVVDTIYPDIPFGIAQQGKAFRNEISPRDFIFRDRELEQMEIEYFVRENEWEKHFEAWKKHMLEWCDAIGLNRANIHELEVPESDRAHYSKRTIDFEYDFPIGREELYGLAYRTDFDLQNIQRASGKNMEYRPKDGSDPFVPHVIEPTFGVERTIMAILTAAYWYDAENERTVLKLPYELAPVKVAVCPLAKNNPELVAKARDIYTKLKKEIGDVLWIDSGNIGKNYRKMDEIGVPYVVTVDFDTLEGDTKDTVTVRSRDTTEQKRTKVSNLIIDIIPQ